MNPNNAMLLGILTGIAVFIIISVAIYIHDGKQIVETAVPIVKLEPYDGQTSVPLPYEPQ